MTGRPLHTALRTPSDELARRPARPTVRQVVERGYAAGVADRVGRGPVTYTDRAALLRAGRHLGIEPVRANLILALQQDVRPTRRLPTAWVALATQAAVIAVGVCVWLA